MSSTPILDRESPPPAETTSGNRMLRLTLGATVGAGLALLPSTGWIPPIPNTAGISLWFLASFYVGVVLHEIGHLLAGLAMGFEFRSLTAGPLSIAREATGLGFRFIPGRIFGGGLTSMVPRSADDLTGRFSVYVLGGSLTTAIICLSGVLLPASAFSYGLVMANLVLGIFTWVPMDARGHYTDAKVLQLLWRRDAVSERLSAALYLAALDGKGIEPRDWPAETLETLVAKTEGKLYRAIARSIYYVYQRSFGPSDGATEALDRVLAHSDELNGHLRRIYFAEAGYWQADVKGNAAMARLWLEDARRVKHGMTLAGWDASTLAAIAMAESKQAEAREHLQQAFAYLDKLPGPSGSIISARRYLRELGAKIDSLDGA